MFSLPDGRLSFEMNSTLRIYDPITGELTSGNIPQYMWSGTSQVVGNYNVWYIMIEKFIKIDFSDINRYSILKCFLMQEIIM